MHFFITGHTGFKGAWLTLLLKELGHKVSGYALEPEGGSLFEKAQLTNELEHHFIGDVRDDIQLKKSLASVSPDFAIHLAAQSLVLRSYQNPDETYTTNVDGTRNFLNATTNLSKSPIALVVTTDKVYKNTGKIGYNEDDPLGGYDPYSTSKAMADLLAQSWALTNPSSKIHVARAGNVVGAFDVSANRLIPDILRASKGQCALSIRNLNSVRPWQHVLDCLAGYLKFLDGIANGLELPVALNFGPTIEGMRTVRDVLAVAQQVNPNLRYSLGKESTLGKEAEHLTLDASRAKNLLGWTSTIGFHESVVMSLAEITCEDPVLEVRKQIQAFVQASFS